jgi:ribose transport system ATP-binding protein
MPNVIQINRLSKSFNEIPVLKNVSMTFEAGRVYAVVGKNGAGKSSLVKLLAGIYQPDEGEIYYNGRKVIIKTPKDALDLRWSFAFQDLELFDNLTIAENVFFNNYPADELGIVNNKKMQERTNELANMVGLRADPELKAACLGMGEKHLVAFMRMLARDADVMVIDEITSALTNQESKKIFEIAGQLKQKGKFIIFVTHNQNEIFEHVDNIIVLRDGEVVIQEDAAKIKDVDLIQSIVGKDVRKRYPKLPARPGKELLRVSNLSIPSVLSNVSFVLNRGEVLGITGLVGSGRTSLAKCIFGIQTRYTGEIYYNRKRVKITSPKDAVKYGIGLVPDDRQSEGIFNVSDLMLNITITHLEAVEHQIIRWLISKSSEKKLTEQYLERLGVDYFSLSQQMKYLSSGNQQKVLIARWLLANMDVLILDEPTKELDIASKVEVYNLINEIVRQGKSVIFISSDFSEIIGMSDRVIALSCGKVVMDMEKDSITKDRILKRVLAEELGSNY